jgi:hypothetical protein
LKSRREERVITVAVTGLWPNIPIGLLALTGLGLIFEAVYAQIRSAGTPWSSTTRLLTWLRGFRLTIIGLALVGIALAWLWDETWLLVLSLSIAGEEIFETSWMISTLEHERRSPISTHLHA